MQREILLVEENVNEKSLEMDRDRAWFVDRFFVDCGGGDVMAPARGVSVDYGKYMVDTHDCRICHGAELNGGPFPDPTITKISPNLTTGGELGFWTEEQFINTIRTGKTPSGHELDPNLMAWNYYRSLYDYELQAIWMYLQSLPKLAQYTE